MENKYDVILSFTSWKGRIYDRKFLYVLQHALEQKTSYKYKVVLVLSEEEFKKKEEELPEDIVMIAKSIPDRFEILWTYKNTKALKKLHPTMKKFPETPIIVFDDDEILAPTCIDKMMSEHLSTPNIILGADCHKLKRGGRIYNKLLLVTHIRLFPPHSLADIDQNIFLTIFGNAEDDIFNALCASMNGTKSRRVGIEKLTIDERWFPVLYSKETNLGKVYRTLNANTIIANLISKYPEYKKYCI